MVQMEKKHPLQCNNIYTVTLSGFFEEDLKCVGGHYHTFAYLI